jgi:tetratricopeptide (TPR) repeat protein
VTLEALTRAQAQGRGIARCRALAAAASLVHLMGRNAEAQVHLEESLSIALELGNEQSVAVAHRLLGVIAYSQGHHRRARTHFQKALAVARRLEQTSQLSGVLAGLAELHRLEGNLDAAEPLLEEALAIARASGSSLDCAVGLLNLAAVSIGCGSGDRARGMLLEALALVEDTGMRILGQGVVEASAGLSALRGEWRRAARLYGAADAQYEQMQLHREPVDEAYLTPLIAKARTALGAAAFAAAEAAGRTLSYDVALGEVRAWLQVGRTTPAGDIVEALRSEP